MRDCIQVTLHAIGHARRVEQRLESEGVWEVLPWEMDVDGKREREDTQGRARRKERRSERAVRAETVGQCKRHADHECVLGREAQIPPSG